MSSTSSTNPSSITRSVTLQTATGGQVQHLFSRADSKYGLGDREVDVVTNFDSNNDSKDGEEFDEERNVMQSLDQLTQEEVDFDESFESADSANNNVIIVEGNADMEECDTGDPPKLAELKQPTMSQYYSKEENPTRPKTKIANFVEFKGRQFMKGDVWQLVERPKSTKHDVYSKLIVKIIGFKTEKRQKMAIVENKIYMHIENLLCLGDNAQSVIDHRRAKGNLGPDFVEYVLGTRSNNSLMKSAPRFPLHWLDKQIKSPVTSDLIFGYEENPSSKLGYFFKFHDSATSERKQIAIPKNSSGKFTVLELYSGAGGNSLGLHNAGFSVTHHVDNDTAACSTLQANFPDSEILPYRVEDFLMGCKENPTSKRNPKAGSVALLHGSTPCQGASLANRNGGANDAANNAEMFQFMDNVKHFQSPFVTFENVKGILQTKHKRYVQKMIAEFLKMEYQVRLCHALASDYGDPQNRPRVFILAAKAGLELPHLPPPTHGDDPFLLAKRTVADAIGFLEEVSPLEYEGEVTAIVDGVAHDLRGHTLKACERNNKDDTFLVADAPALTVLKKGVIRHYKCGKRRLTRLEQSLLQSFPPSFSFYGTDSEIRDQIGNAVPVCLATAIGKSVMEAIMRSGG